MNPLSPRAFIEHLRQANGQNNDGGAERAQDLNRHINTGFTNQDRFIYELLQNADDQLNHTDDVNFVVNESELIFYHSGKPFDQKDVKGICSFGNVEENRKNENKEMSGYKDIGFKSVFRYAYSVCIISENWRFHFDQNSPLWKKDSKYTWQIAPIWTEDNAISPTVKKIMAVQGRTIFAFKMRPERSMDCQLKALIDYPERILFLKKIRKIKLILEGKETEISCDKGDIYLGSQLHTSWRTTACKIAIPHNIQKYLQNLGPEECPKWLKQENEFTLSLSYPEKFATPTINFFSTLPTAEGAGFPFLANAPLLLNPSRENLLDGNEWNVFVIETIAQCNFNHVYEALNAGNFNSLFFLGPEKIIIPHDKLRIAYNKKMEALLQIAFLPAEFGNHRINLHACAIDETGLYHAFNQYGIITEGPKELVSGNFDINEIKKRNPNVCKLSLKELVQKIPGSLEKRSQTLSLEESIRIIHLLFNMYQSSILPESILAAIKKVYLYTEEKDTLKRCLQLCLPDCYKPSFQFEALIGQHKDCFISSAYLITGKEKEMALFFQKMGAIKTFDFQFKDSCEVLNLEGDPLINSYFSKVRSIVVMPSNRNYHVAGDTIFNFGWFPFIGLLDKCPAYQNVFWRQLLAKEKILLSSYSRSQFQPHYGRGGKQEVNWTFLQYVFNHFKLIQNQEGTFCYAHELYAPSLTGNTPLKNTARLPVKLSPETEEWLCFQKHLDVDDCNLFIKEQEKKFDFSNYSFLMKQFLKCLTNQNERKINRCPLQFYTTEGTWEYPGKMKYWLPAHSSPPQSAQKWIEKPDQFTQEEMIQLCKFFKIEMVSEYTDLSHLALAQPCEDLWLFLESKMLDITYLWKRLKSDRTAADCSKFITSRLKNLTYLLLPEENFSEGQLFIKENNLYYSIGWDDKKNLLANILGTYLGYNQKEINDLESALGKNPRRYGQAEAPHFELFKNEFLRQLGKLAEVDPTPPPSPMSLIFKKIPIDFGEESDDTEFEVDPQSGSDEETPPSSPSKLTVPSSVKKSIPRGTPSGKRSRGPVNPHPNEDPDEEDLLEKKRIGMWAEKHIYWNLTDKFKKKGYAITADTPGHCLFNKEGKAIELKWYNHPKNRPTGKENDELWDSGNPFDIEYKKTKPDNAIKLRKIEVKGTRSNKVHFFLGSTEWAEFAKTKDCSQYHIYVVTRVETDTPCLKIYKNIVAELDDFTFISKTQFSGPVLEPK